MNRRGLSREPDALRKADRFREYSPRFLHRTVPLRTCSPCNGCVRPGRRLVIQSDISPRRKAAPQRTQRAQRAWLPNACDLASSPGAQRLRAATSLRAAHGKALLEVKSGTTGREEFSRAPRATRLAEGSSRGGSGIACLRVLSVLCGSKTAADLCRHV
jgi:hypothetical protein